MSIPAMHISGREGRAFANGIGSIQTFRFAAGWLRDSTDTGATHSPLHHEVKVIGDYVLDNVKTHPVEGRRF
jgi:hypothetical protein